MRKFALLFAFVTSVFLNAETPSYITFPSDISWLQMDSDNFRIIYREGQQRFAERTLKAAEKSRKVLMTVFTEAPEKTWIVLADFQDSMNGYALDFPYPHMVLFAMPPEPSGQLAPVDDWLYSLVLHEYTHILHLWPAKGLWKFMRSVFGSWVVPNGMLPSHFHEGMATFMETHFTKGGRGKGSAYSMYIRKAVESGTWGNEFAPLDLFDGSPSRWPHGTSPYFFGYLLHEDLWGRKGKPGFQEITDSYASNWPYLVHGPAVEVYGKNYDELWGEIFAKKKAQALSDLESIKKQPLSKLDYLTNSRFHKSDLALLPGETRIAYRSQSPEQGAKIRIFDVAKRELVDQIALEPGGDEGLCAGRSKDKDWLIYTAGASRDQYNLTGIFAYDVTEKKAVRLGGKVAPWDHMHLVECSADLTTILAYTERGGVGAVLELKWTPGQEKTEVARSWKVPEGNWINGFLVTENAHWIAVRHNVSTALYKWEKGKNPALVRDLPWRVFSLRASPTPGKLLAVADADGRNEVWEIDPDSGTMKKRAASLGGFSSFDFGKEMWATSYEHGGFDIAKVSTIDGKSVSATETKVETPKDTDNEKISVSVPENYSPVSSLFPKAWMPSLLFVPDGMQVGVLIPGFDVSQKHVYDLFGGYDSRGLPFGSFAYTYRFARTFSFDINPYYIPSYLNATKTFIKRFGGAIGINGTLGFVPTTWRVAALYKRVDLETLGPNDSLGFEVGLSHRFGFARTGSFYSIPSGIRAGVNFQKYMKAVGSTRDYYALVGSLDQVWALPFWDRSAFTLTTKMGVTEGTRFIDSYYESGGELLFSQGRGMFLNRGFAPGTFFGRRVANANLEYRFPLMTVERGSGLSPAFLYRIHAALVGDATSSDRDPNAGYIQQSIFKQWFFSAGAEIKSEWKFFYYLPTQLRFGVYHGFASARLADQLNFVFGMEAGI